MNSVYIQKHFTENLKISKELSAYGFRTNFLSIENSSNISVKAEKIQSNNNSVGIFLNYNCNGSKDLLNSVSCAFDWFFSWEITWTVITSSAGNAFSQDLNGWFMKISRKKSLAML